MDLITRIEATALSFDDLKRMAGLVVQKILFIQYNQLADYRDIQQLFENHKYVVILLQIEKPNAPKVGHWIGLLNLGDHVEHFDPYGLDVDEELALTHEKEYLKTILGTVQTRLVNNQVRLQQFREHVNTCGRWVIARIRFAEKGATLNEMVEAIKSVHDIPDIVISVMTLFL